MNFKVLSNTNHSVIFSLHSENSFPVAPAEHKVRRDFSDYGLTGVPGRLGPGGPISPFGPGCPGGPIIPPGSPYNINLNH